YIKDKQEKMLAKARESVNEGEHLLIEEPSKGLAPIDIEKVMEAMIEMKKTTTIVLVEQNFLMASKIGDTYTLIDDGETVHAGTMEELVRNDELQHKYLGIG